MHRFKARYKDIFEPSDYQGQDGSMDGLGITTTQPMMVGELMLTQDASKSGEHQVHGQETSHLQFPTNPLAAPHLQGIDDDSNVEL